jgi:hypothetical protein
LPTPVTDPALTPPPAPTASGAAHLPEAPVEGSEARVAETALPEPPKAGPSGPTVARVPSAGAGRPAPKTAPPAPKEKPGKPVEQVGGVGIANEF